MWGTAGIGLHLPDVIALAGGRSRAAGNGDTFRTTQERWSYQNLTNPDPLKQNPAEVILSEDCHTKPNSVVTDKMWDQESQNPEFPIRGGVGRAGAPGVHIGIRKPDRVPGRFGLPTFFELSRRMNDERKTRNSGWVCARVVNVTDPRACKTRWVLVDCRETIEQTSNEENELFGLQIV